MVDDIRHRQEHIECLENYIDELTEKIDELTGGRDFEKRIRKLEYRMEVLKKSDEQSGLFKARINELKKELIELTAEYEKLRPVLEELEVERAYYRTFQSKL